MNSRDILIKTLNHKWAGRIPVDFGSNAVTGIHIRIVEQLRHFYGLKKHPVKVIEPYQMLGEIEEDLMEILGIDVIGLWGPKNMFGISQKNWKLFKTFWGQEILVPQEFNPKMDEKGDLLIYPEGDKTVAPSAKMPKSGFFFDAIIRQKPIDESTLHSNDNLEEFAPISEEEIVYWKEQVEHIPQGKGVVANFGGMGLGDIALVPAMNLKNPKGIRDISEWYMSTLFRPDFIHEVFEKQTDIALNNLEKLHKVIGDKIDVVFICGTDFGTQHSSFCSVETYEELYAPYYLKMNDWIHQNTTWKTFKHSCGAVEGFMKSFIDSGFDIINPVQISATGMVPEHLKKEYGDYLTFWGGGVDTQTTLPYGSSEEVKKQVHETCEIFSKNGGFVFNTIHNIQANVPIQNVIAMFDALKEINK